MSESYPSDWVKINLMVSPTGEFHAIGGDRIPGVGDQPYIGLERLNKNFLFDDLTQELISLLDRIELDDDASLSSQRFDIAKKHGHKVIIKGWTSSEKH